MRKLNQRYKFIIIVVIVVGRETSASAARYIRC